MTMFSFDLDQIQLMKNQPNVFTPIAYLRIPAGGKVDFPAITRAIIKLYGKDDTGTIKELDIKDEIFIGYKLPAQEYVKPLTQKIRYRTFKSLSVQEQRDVNKTPKIEFTQEMKQMLPPGIDGLSFPQDVELYVMLKSGLTLAIDSVDELSQQTFELPDVKYY